jgi:hypothetical protein
LVDGTRYHRRVELEDTTSKSNDESGTDFRKISLRKTYVHLSSRSAAKIRLPGIAPLSAFVLDPSRMPL